MKLLSVLTRKYLIFSMVYFIIGGFGIYIALNSIALEEIDERMESTRSLLINQLKKGLEPESFWHYWEISKNINPDSSLLYSRDTVIVTPDENEAESFQQLKFIETIKGTRYLITLRTPRMESYNLLIAIALPVGILLIIWMFFFLFLNRRISSQIWSSFHSNLERLKKFSVADDSSLKLDKSNIDEYEMLRGVLEDLTNKGISDFKNLRVFSENASHEIQTPLSDISSRIENMLNKHHLDPDLAVEIKKIYSSVQRLSKTNKSLLLLSKIENRQFELSKNTDISIWLSKDIESFTDQIQEKQIKFSKKIEKTVFQDSNRELFRILVNNLIGNSIRHNHIGGDIVIVLNQSHLLISNTGLASKENPEKWFGRFSKANPSSPSSGLGLAIAKEICELHKWKISYSIVKSRHILQVRF